jgi:Reverse transcriptase (RNA-dependent DNA polymerase).
MEFVESQNKLVLFQSGFRRRHSTATALVKVADDVRLSLDAGKATILVLLDMSKAFDSMDFEVLIATLKGMGLSDNTLSWIGSYLRGRRQRVMHDGTYSEWKLGLPTVRYFPEQSVFLSKIKCSAGH